MGVVPDTVHWLCVVEGVATELRHPFALHGGVPPFIHVMDGCNAVAMDTQTK